MLRSTRKSGTAALLAVTIAAAASVAIIFSAQATAQTALAPVPTAITATAAPTAAPLVRLQCTSPSTNAFSFQPFLSTVVQPTFIRRTTIYRRCSAPGFPNIRSGYNYVDFTINDSCALMVATGGTSGFTITWNDTQTTTFVANRSTSLVGNVFTTTYTGTVTAGLFVGRPVRQVFTADATELVQCLAGAPVVVPFLISDVVLTIS